MVFSASCNSPKTPQSPKRRVTTPRPVARRLPPALRALSIAARTAWAPASPARSWTWSMICPWAASFPRRSAVRAMMRISPGASAKTV
jgi:hypothetical protein